MQANMERLTRDAFAGVLRVFGTGTAGVKVAGAMQYGRWQLHHSGELDPCSDASGADHQHGSTDEGLDGLQD